MTEDEKTAEETEERTTDVAVEEDVDADGPELQAGPRPDSIFEVRALQNGRGMRLDHLVPLPEFAERGEPEFFLGKAILGTPMGPNEMQFPIIAKDVTEAFAKFEASAEEASKLVQKRMASQIIRPGQRPGGPPGPGGILAP